MKKNHNLKRGYDVTGCCNPLSKYLLVEGEKGFSSGVSLADIISDIVNEPTITVGDRNITGKITKNQKWIGGSLKDIIISNEVDSKKVYIRIPYAKIKYAYGTREILECSISDIEFGYCNKGETSIKTTEFKTVDLVSNSEGKIVAEISQCDYQTRILEPSTLCVSDKRSLVLVLNKIFKTYHIDD